jgi:hypothetical protein
LIGANELRGIARNDVEQERLENVSQVASDALAAASLITFRGPRLRVKSSAASQVSLPDWQSPTGQPFQCDNMPKTL